MKIIILLLFISFSFFAYAQKFDMKGYLIIDGSKIKYEIDFKIENDSLLSGQTVTGRGTNYETISSVKGKYNKQKNILEFIETKNTFEKSNNKKTEYCFIRGHFKVITKNNKSIISGDFTGKDLQNRFCGKGILFLSSDEEINKKIEEVISKKIKDYEMPEIDENKIITIDTIQNKFLLSNNTYTYETPSSELVLEFIDFSNYDNDSIALMVNNKIIFDHFKLTDKFKPYTLKLSELKSDTIRMRSLNEGDVSPNTSSFNIFDKQNNKYFKFNINGLKNEEVILLITKPKKK